MTPQLLTRILVPVANEDDARATCDAIKTHLEGDVEFHAVHVIEKAGGAPDKAPLAAREEQAETIFDLLENQLAGTTYDLTTELRYATSVVDEIVKVAEKREATAITFTPRSSGPVTKYFAGNKTQTLVAASRIPVIVLPREEEKL